MDRQPRHQEQHQQLLLINQREYNESLENKERMITKLAQHADRVTDQNNRLKHQLLEVTNERDRLQHKLKSDPLYNIFSQQQFHPSDHPTQAFRTYQQLQLKMTIDQNKLSKNAQEIAILQNKLLQHQKIIKNQQIHILNLIQKQRQLSGEVYEIKCKLSSKNDEIDRLHRTVKNSQDSYNRLLAELESIRNDVDNKGRYDTAFINDINNKINKLTDDWTLMGFDLINPKQQPHFSQQKIRKLQQTTKNHQKIAQEMGKLCDILNDEITKLKKEVDIFKDSYKNVDMKQLSRQHSLTQMSGTSQSWARNYNLLVNKFYQMTEVLKKSTQDKQYIRKQFENVKTELDSLKPLKEQYNLLLKKYKRSQEINESYLEKDHKNDQQLIDLLQQNQALHKFMQSIYGSKSYQDRIKDQVFNYQDRQLKRQNQNKWANVGQLVRMNNKLMDRLKRL